MHWVVATWVPLSLKVKQLTWHSPEAASSIKQSQEIHLEEVYEEHCSQHPVWSGLNTFHSTIPFAFCTYSLQPQGLCTCCLYLLPGTPFFYLTNSNLSLRSWLNYCFITKAFLNLWSSTPSSIWVKGQDFRIRMTVFKFQLQCWLCVWPFHASVFSSVISA